MNREKRHQVLIEAMPAILEAFPSAHLVLVGELFGDAAYYSYLRQVVSRNRLESKISFAGFREDIADVISAADVLILPSVDEPLGRSVLEALGLAAQHADQPPTGVLDGIQEALSRMRSDPGQRGLEIDIAIERLVRFAPTDRDHLISQLLLRWKGESEPELRMALARVIAGVILR